MLLQKQMVGLLKGINIVAKKLGISTEVGNLYKFYCMLLAFSWRTIRPHLHFHLFVLFHLGKMVSYLLFLEYFRDKITSGFKRICFSHNGIFTLI